jgi:2-amino-4-hydroxy-6-hydroxymethyldihydropteridine diphosphokinase
MGAGQITAYLFGVIGILKSLLAISEQSNLNVRNMSYQKPMKQLNFLFRSKNNCYNRGRQGRIISLSSKKIISYRHLTTKSEDYGARSSYKYQVYLAVGSNLGDRFHNIRTALRLLTFDSNVRLIRTSFLYETKPMYVTDQRRFLNGAIEIQTDLNPLDLLACIKSVEGQLGRDFLTIRNGPRPVDIDILTYTELNQNKLSYENMITMDTCNLTIPHKSVHQRDFVLIPFIDVASPNYVISGINLTLSEMLHQLTHESSTQDNFESSALRVLPLPRGRLLYFSETLVMGILNVTPDSFSDGGKWTASVDVAINKALSMEKEGAAIIDIGGESTRPGATETSIDEQIRRTIPIIEGIRKGLLY